MIPSDDLAKLKRRFERLYERHKEGRLWPSEAAEMNYLVDKKLGDLPFDEEKGIFVTTESKEIQG